MSQDSQALGKRPGKKGITVTWRGVVLIIVVVLLLVFAVQNLQTATVNFLGGQIEVWMWLIVVVAFLLGMALGGVVKAGARKLRKPEPPTSTK
jgi:uncharacterized integral membrane protein